MEKKTELKEFKITHTEEKEDQIVYYMRAKAYKPVCPFCNAKKCTIHAKTIREVRDIQEDGKKVILSIEGNRYKCSICSKVFSETYLSIDTKARFTNRLRNRIQNECLKKPISQIAYELDLSESTIRKVFQAYLKEVQEKYQINTPQSLGICLITIGKSKRCVLIDLDHNQPIEILNSTSAQELKHFIKTAFIKEQITTVVTDLHTPFITILREQLPDTILVIEKAAVLQKAIFIFKHIHKEFKATCSKTERNFLVHDLAILTKDSTELTQEETKTRNTWFKRFQILKKAYESKENINALYEANTKEEAKIKYEEWKIKVSANKDSFQEMKSIIETYKEEIFSYYDLTDTQKEYTFNNIKELIKSEDSKGISYEAIRAKLLFMDNINKCH